MFKLLTLVSVLGVTALLAACGGGEDPSAQSGTDGVVGVSEQYLAGFADGNGRDACSLLGATSQEVLIRQQGTTDCLAAVEAGAKALSPDQRDELRSAEVTALSADGGKGAATVDIDAETQKATGLSEGRISLKQVDGHWEIELPGI